MSTQNFTFEVWGENALFTDPLTKSGEKMTYQVPTYQALVGIASSIYWKPTFVFIIDKVRIMNEIRIESKAMRPFDKNLSLSKNTLAYYAYLHKVRYQVECHIEWNLQRPELVDDRNTKKHAAIFNRALKAGGRRDIFLGTRECQGYVKPVTFGEGTGHYDDTDRQFGVMVHGYNYPDETGDPMLSVRLWAAKMEKGVIHFPRPEACTMVQPIRKIKQYTWQHPDTIQTADALYAEMFGGGSR
ncbi:type I-C CRISPR-associated protein Cas5 [Lacticaseibacillus casei]|uniref:pre-crRNA processing endonuclease n=2 Tax=Lacticaseibacillus zeae TaxID=57037 RepID=A0A5R8M4Y5_LACZE|nr:type I-C CRISPR-associated protein Cas5c [Lacticaseibacillus zeae]OLS04312.1 type I-C CRISPR-associated protein Cas5 [Lacticaseibacillus casei]QVI33109.1 type I-C CRISPR-associated protein Cas5 [Lacticaseibacillus zeae]TLF43699.1 type I-C CRISPR-associated protein Cas5 [Lacticaseibacillus zeae]